MFQHPIRHAKNAAVTACLVGLSGMTASALANDPGKGWTAREEVGYLEFIIDHHYSALRMTELAAGTDLQRDAQISPMEGTAPTPGTAATPAKATLPEIRSMARRNNRGQREQILTAQRFLRDWYRIDYAPHLTPEGQHKIQLLEQTPAGPQFDHVFLEAFSRHHYNALAPSETCIVASDLRHDELQRYCNGIVHSQTEDIMNMRALLLHRFGIVDYQPTLGLKGRHAGGDGAVIPE